MPSPPPQTRDPEPHISPSRRKTLLITVSALLLTVLVGLLVAKAHPGLGTRMGPLLRSLSPLQLCLGVLAIYAGVALRAVRWALLMPREHRPPARSLVAPQFVGFAAVSLFGRVADLARPFLVARRTGTPVTMQIALYSLERAFDLAATAVLFSAMLLFVPRSAPHHEAFSRAGILASLATAFLLIFALVLRSAGERLAHAAGKLAARFSPKLANSAAARILELQAGFASMRSLAQFAGAFAVSLVIWLSIASSYLFVAHSFTATPQLATLRLPAILLLMATSMGASLLQLPIIGWFTTAAAIGAAYHGFYGAPPAAASLCGALSFTIITLSVIPPGLLLARRSGLSLRDLRRGTASPSAAA